MRSVKRLYARSMKKRRILWISLICVLLIITGCSQIRISTDSEWMMKMDESKLEKEEVRTIALTQSSLFQQFYVPLTGSEFWNQLIEENQTFESYAKDTIVFEEAAALTILNAIADSWELELTDSEKDLAKQAANEYFDIMSKEAKRYTGANRSDVTRLIQKYVRALDVIDLLAEDVNMEVSDNEMRVMDIQVIIFSDQATAQQVKAQVDAGTDFLSMAKQYSITNTYEYSVRRGELAEALENIVFAMDSGTVTEVIPVGDEFYLIKCVNDYNETLSEENRSNIQQQRIYEMWMDTAEDFVLDRKLEINERSWNHLSLELNTEAQNTQLFDIIENYFPSILQSN